MQCMENFEKKLFLVAAVALCKSSGIATRHVDILSLDQFPSFMAPELTNR